jgi:hypothetical protein
MVCDTRPLRKEQTLEQRKQQVREIVVSLARDLAAGRVRVQIGPQGAVAFPGWLQGQQGGVSDACALRLIQQDRQLSPLTKQALLRAEMLSGRKINQRAIAAGIHSHDGGKTWGPGH